MKKIRNIVFISLIVIVSQNCTPKISSNTIVNPIELKEAICQSVNVPFMDYDTLIYDSRPSTLSGQSNKPTKDIPYLPIFDSTKYISLMSKKINKTILYNYPNLKLNSSTGTIILKSELKPSANKIELAFNGNVIKNDSVLIIECAVKH
jgi:hypothetical protein